MNALDTTLVVIIAGFGVSGFLTGLIQVVGSLVGSVVGVMVASRSFRSVGGFALPFFGGNELASAITSFIILFVLTSKAVGFLFYLIDKAYKLASIIPGLKLLNRIGGLGLGLVEGIVIIGVILNLITRMPLSESALTTVENSAIMQFCITLTGWLTPLFPEVLEKAKTVL